MPFTAKIENRTILNLHCKATLKCAFNGDSSVTKLAFKRLGDSQAECVWQPYLDVKRVVIACTGKAFGGTDQNCFDLHIL